MVLPVPMSSARRAVRRSTRNSTPAIWKGRRTPARPGTATSAARLAGGSDFPVEPPNPFYGLHAAVTRQSRDGAPPQGWRMAEAMTMQQAFAAFTTGAAWAGHAEGKVGTLTPGKWADFIITGQDPFAVAPADVWRVRVDETWLGGKRVFLRK